MREIEPKHYPAVFTVKKLEWDALRQVCPVAPGYPVYKDWTITTVDLLNTINRLKNSSDIEYCWLTWHTAYSLMVLAKERLCELAYYFLPEGRPYFYNLTETNTPYWSTKFIYGDHDNCCYPVFVKDNVSKGNCLFARATPNAEEIIRQNCLDKVWYEVKVIKSPESNTQKTLENTETDTVRRKDWLLKTDFVIINDGTKPLPYDFDAVIE